MRSIPLCGSMRNTEIFGRWASPPTVAPTDSRSDRSPTFAGWCDAFVFAGVRMRLLSSTSLASSVVRDWCGRP